MTEEQVVWCSHTIIFWGAHLQFIQILLKWNRVIVHHIFGTTWHPHTSIYLSKISKGISELVINLKINENIDDSSSADGWCLFGSWSQPIRSDWAFSFRTASISFYTKSVTLQKHIELCKPCNGDLVHLNTTYAHKVRTGKKWHLLFLLFLWLLISSYSILCSLLLDRLSWNWKLRVNMTYNIITYLFHDSNIQQVIGNHYISLKGQTNLMNVILCTKQS